MGRSVWRFIHEKSRDELTSVTSRLDSDEGPEETEEDGEDGDSDVHVEADGKDDAGEDDHDDETGNPDPGRNLLFLSSRVDSGGFGVLERGILASPNLDRVDGGLGGVTKSSVESWTLNGDFGESTSDHDQDTDPKEPVTRGDVVGGWVGGLHAVVGDDGGAGVTVGGDIPSDGPSGDDEGRSDDAPCEDGASEERAGSVDTREDTGTEESGSPFEEPT